MVVMYITTKRRDVELDRASIKLELPDFLKLYDPVNAPVLPATVPLALRPCVDPSSPIVQARSTARSSKAMCSRTSHCGAWKPTMSYPWCSGLNDWGCSPSQNWMHGCSSALSARGAGQRMAPTQCRKRRISGSRHVGVASWDTSTGLIIREHHTVLPLV